MHERHRFSAVGERVLERSTNEPLRACGRYRLDAESRVALELPPELLVQVSDELVRLGSAGLDLLAGVHVFGVLPEDDHVDQFRFADGRWDAAIPAHRTQARIEVEDLADGDVQAADAPSHGGRERAFDANEMIAERLYGLLGKPFPGGVERLLAGQHLLPRNGTLTAVRLLDGGIEDVPGSTPDVGTDAVSLDERDDRVIGDDQTVGTLRDDFWHEASSLSWSRDANPIRRVARRA